jgi:hypothetical protein
MKTILPRRCFPELLINLQEGPGLGNARNLHQDIDVSVPADSSFHHPVDLALLPHIAHYCSDTSPVRGDLSRGLGHHLAIDIANDEPRSFFREANRNRLADTLGAAYYKGDLVTKAVGNEIRKSFTSSSHGVPLSRGPLESQMRAGV